MKELKRLIKKGLVAIEAKHKWDCDLRRAGAARCAATRPRLTSSDRRLNFGHQWQGNAYAKVYLTHRCPIGLFREKKIKKAPYYCKQCAQCIISAEQGPNFCLPVDRTVVPKIQISIASLKYSSDPKTDFDTGDMVLTRYDGWVHKCPAVAVSPVPNWSPSWIHTKQTLTALPFKCKLCKQRVCEEGMTFAKLANMAKILGALEKKR